MSVIINKSRNTFKVWVKLNLKHIPVQKSEILLCVGKLNFIKFILSCVKIKLRNNKLTKIKQQHI